MPDVKMIHLKIINSDLHFTGQHTVPFTWYTASEGTSQWYFYTADTQPFNQQTTTLMEIEFRRRGN